jgi:23S rRNA pseudouridine2604 synthase
MSDKNATRLNKYISESGICSRREADKHIELGRVFINGRKAVIGDQVLPDDKVMVNGMYLEPKEAINEILIALNKPVGVTSTTEASTKNNIVDYVNHSQRIFPIGRLDKDSQGLILLTNNGDIVNKILRAGNNHEKEYLVTVDKAITDNFINGMANGVPMLGVTTKKCVVKKESPFVFRVFLIQGLNRQIRRMCEHFNYEVIKLERVRIMNISLKGIPVGDWRELTPQEKDGIYNLIEKSSSSNDKPASKKPIKKKNTKGSFDELLLKPAKKPQKQWKPNKPDAKSANSNKNHRTKPGSTRNSSNKNKPKSKPSGRRSGR